MPVVWVALNRTPDLEPTFLGILIFSLVFFFLLCFARAQSQITFEERAREEYKCSELHF